MEISETAGVSAEHVFYFITLHPQLAVIGTIIGILMLLRLYCRMTLGTCDCTTDMTGKTVIVTGANTGIGKFTAMELAKKGARVILACRNRKRGERALKEIVDATRNRNVILKDLDLCSFASVRAFVDDILKTEDKLNVLINNAGAIIPSRRLTEDGCETTMQSNHLGHFLMTCLLLDLLKKSAPSRIINVSSEAHRRAKLNLDDINGVNKTYSQWIFYCNSKIANILFTRELAKRLNGTGVTANSLHPGVVQSEFGHGGFLTWLVGKIFLPIVGKSSLEGAQTSIHLAVSPYLENVTGLYFMDCKKRKPTEWSKDEERAAKLWRVSEKLVGLNNEQTT